MGEVVEFPGFAEWNWRGIEHEVSVFLKGGLSEDAIIWISAELKRRVFEKLQAAENPGLDVPAETSPDVVRNVSEQIRDKYTKPLVTLFIGQMAMALTELYLAKQAAD